MKQSVLLLDASCAPCSEFGKQLQAEGLLAGSDLSVGSLHDERYKDHVSKFEPTLLRYDDAGVVSTSSGMRLAIDLVRIVGPRRAFRVATLARDATSHSAFDPSRRSFLVKAASAAAILPLAGVLGANGVSAQESAGEENTGPAPLTAVEAKEAYDLLRASTDGQSVLNALQADGVKHVVDSTFVQLPEGDMASSTAHAMLGYDDPRVVVLTLLLATGEQNETASRIISAGVDIDNNKVITVAEIDATDAKAPINESRTIKAANIARVPIPDDQDNTSSPYRQKPIQNWTASSPAYQLRVGVGDTWEFDGIRVNRFVIADGAVTVNASGELKGLTLTLTQAGRTARGVLDTGNSFADEALGGFTADADIKVSFTSTIAPDPIALTPPTQGAVGTSGTAPVSTTSAPAGTVRIKGRSSGGAINITVKDGAWSGTPDLFASREEGATGACGPVEYLYCTLSWTAAGYERVCKWAPPRISAICTLVTLFVMSRVCHHYLVIVCTD